MSEPVIVCPHCNEYILIEKLNCGIFRHGILKDTYEQIKPHSSKDICDNYVTNNLIHGCGKPFKIVLKNDIFVSEICDYI